MPSPTPIVVTDGTTPHTLVPIGIVGGVNSFRDTTGAILAANRKLTVSCSESSVMQRRKLRFTSPLVTINADGLTEAYEEAIFSIDARLPSVMPRADRVSFIKEAFSLAADEFIVAVLENGEAIW